MQNCDEHTLLVQPPVPGTGENAETDREAQRGPRPGARKLMWVFLGVTLVVVLIVAQIPSLRTLVKPTNCHVHHVMGKWGDINNAKVDCTEKNYTVVTTWKGCLEAAAQLQLTYPKVVSKESCNLRPMGCYTVSTQRSEYDQWWSLDKDDGLDPYDKGTHGWRLVALDSRRLRSDRPREGWPSPFGESEKGQTFWNPCSGDPHPFNAAPPRPADPAFRYRNIICQGAEVPADADYMCQYDNDPLSFGFFLSSFWRFLSALFSRCWDVVQAIGGPIRLA